MDSTPAAVMTLSKMANNHGPESTIEASEPRKRIGKVRIGKASSKERVSPRTFMLTRSESCSNGSRTLKRLSGESIYLDYTIGNVKRETSNVNRVSRIVKRQTSNVMHDGEGLDALAGLLL